jgi:hypothetical protein
MYLLSQFSEGLIALLMLVGIRRTHLLQKYFSKNILDIVQALLLVFIGIYGVVFPITYFVVNYAIGYVLSWFVPVTNAFGWT